MIRLTMPQVYVLSSLEGQDRYGLEIIKAVKKIAGQKLILGSLYNILSKLERDDLIEGYWRDGETEDRGGHRRKYYKITAAGERTMDEVRGGLGRMWGMAFG